jgi:hypothetical protein
MRSNKRPQDRFPSLTPVNSYASAYFDAWQKYMDTLNDVWGDVTAPDAQLGAWTSGFSKLLQAWSNGVSEVCGATTYQAHGGTEEHVVAFVVGREAQDTDPKSVSLPSALQCAHIDWTPLRGTGAASGSEIDKNVLRVTTESGGRCLSIALVNLKSIDDARKVGMYFALVYEGNAPSTVSPPPQRPLAVVVITFV